MQLTRPDDTAPYYIQSSGRFGEPVAELFIIIVIVIVIVIVMLILTVIVIVLENLKLSY